MPIRLNVTVDAKAVQAKLQRGSNLSDSLRTGMKKGVLYVQSQVPGYPAPPAGSTYTRTGTLGRSVTSMQGQAPGALSRVESVGAHSIGYIGTNIVYAPYVIDENEVAFMHKGRWWTLQNVVKGAVDGVVKIIRAAISDRIGD